MNNPLERAFKAELEKVSQPSAQDDELDLFGEETEEEIRERERGSELRRQQINEAARAKQEAYEKRREAFERGEIEPVKVDVGHLRAAVLAAVDAEKAPLVALADAMRLDLMGTNRAVLEKTTLGGPSWLEAIQTGYTVSQGHYATAANKRFGTASALLCLAKAGTYPNDEQITKLANLLNEVLDERLTAGEAAERMGQK